MHAQRTKALEAVVQELRNEVACKTAELAAAEQALAQLRGRAEAAEHEVTYESFESWCVYASNATYRVLRGTLEAQTRELAQIKYALTTVFFFFRRV